MANEASSPGKKSFHKRVDSALAKGHSLLIHYQKLNGRTVKRRIEPRSWRGHTLVAYDHKRKAVRSFRMERVKHMEKVALTYTTAGTVGGALGGAAGGISSKGTPKSRLLSAAVGAVAGGAGGHWAGSDLDKKKLEKGAMDPGLVGAMAGVASGHSAGKRLAGSTANRMSSHGSKTHNEDTARALATATALIGGLGGAALAYKHRPTLMGKLEKHLTHPDVRSMVHHAIPGVGGIGGGLAAGGLTGAAMSLRGKSHEKKAADEPKHDPEKFTHWAGPLGKRFGKQENSTMSELFAGFDKKASAFAHGAELAGLGFLGRDVPKHWNSEDPEKRRTARTEGVGLGILAAPSAIAAAKGAYSKAKPLLSRLAHP